MRGDDAIGPKLVERFEQLSIQLDIDHCWDFQFCPEHALGFCDYDCILLIDASTEIKRPFCLKNLIPDEQLTTTSHSLSPAGLYKVFLSHILEKDKKKPLVLQLEIKAYQFELGSSLSARAQENLNIAWNYLHSILLQHHFFMVLYKLIRA